ncbi:MAG: SGNH/GDSL hydrolase family protein [Chitinophagaceae bacterium]|nr:SGNH/GDSL hydrolase family protein [Chitinophagaceae bacterium]
MDFNRFKPGIVFILMLFILAGLMACSKESSTTPELPPTPPFNPGLVNPPIRMIALGDSYTIGQGVEITDRFPHQTADLLRKQQKSIIDPEYIAQTGWTTSNLLSAIEGANKPLNYDIVTLLIGVNNQYQGRDTLEYYNQFRLCLNKAINLSGRRKPRVFVLSIPDYGVTPFGQRLNPEKIAREIDIFNRINAQIARDSGISYIEITEGSRLAKNDLSLVAQDGLHPSGKEYAKWADKLTASILNVLR